MYSDENSFEKIMERQLSNPDLNDIDKRPGSIIYDSLAPMAMELADLYAKIDILEEQTYLLTASGINLDKRVFDFGILRIPSTKAKRIASFKKYKLDSKGNPEKDEKGNKILVDMDVSELPIGARFAVPSESQTITYVYIGQEDGHNILQCEQLGTIGNGYEGTILPISPVVSLIESKITGVYVPANDTESDNDLRNRTIESINRQAFGGNIADYIEKVKEIEGAGNCKVFPAWNKNGSVLISVVDSQFNPASTEFQAVIKNKLDPEELTGQGYGLAPIGHYVTVTTPTKQFITIKVTVELRETLLVGNVEEKIEKEIENYFKSVRHEFKQDNNLAIYKSKIIESVLKVDGVTNVTSVLLNGVDKDINYKDEAKLNKQYLPYIQEVIVA